MTNPSDNAALAAAFNAISPATATLQAGAATLNAQTTTETVDVPVGTVEGYLRTNMLMGGLQRFVANPPTGAPAALVEGLGELLGMLASPHVQVVQMTNPTVAGAVGQILSGAVSAGLMTSAQETALMALATPTANVWQPPVQIADLQRIQRAGLIPAGIVPYPGYVAPA